MNRPLNDLHQLLSESQAAALERERTTFDRQAGPFSKSLVLFGAGGFGRLVLRRLRSLGIEPLAFCDNNPKLWKQRADGLEVYSPEDAVKTSKGRAAFVVTIWSDVLGHPITEVTRQLQGFGSVPVISFVPLFWKYPEVFLPYFSLDLPHKILLQAEAVLRGVELWGDARSQQEYVGQLRWRLGLDHSHGTASCIDNSYFQPDLIADNSDEVFVDCGAFDGDTLRSVLKRGAGRFKRIIALEPDPANYSKLRAYIDSLAPEVQGKIDSFPLAVGASQKTLRFGGSGTEQARASNSGAVEVQCTTLDDVASRFRPTYIKMDIEGAEPDAILGARSIIRQNKPVLAISAYHEPAHLWEIPLLIRTLADDYTFALRPHGKAVWDLICYAIPPSRLAANGTR